MSNLIEAPSVNLANPLLKCRFAKDMDSPVEYEIKPAQSTRIGLKELWASRELIYFFTWRDVKIKYKQTVLGAMWVFIQPFLLMVVFTLFFSRALKVTSGNLPYPLFVYTGLMFWNVFSSGISNAGNSMVTNANIIKKIYFPRLIIPISSVLSPVVDFSVTFILFIGMLFFYPTDFSFFRIILLLPVSMIITLLTTFGLGSLLASLNVKYRDFRYVIPFLLQVLLFLTPVIYPVTILNSDSLRVLYATSS